MNLQSAISEWLTALATLLPFGYAFGAGMVASVNPCGFAMMPAYLSIYLGQPTDTQHAAQVHGRNLLFAVWVGTSVSAGFILLFTFAGLLLAAGGTFLMPIMPWVGSAIGLALVILALLGLAGRGPTLTAAQKIGDQMMPVPQRSGRTFFMFGIAYGLASLSCTIPIFMIAAGSALASSSFIDGIVKVLSYALGMTTVIISLTLALALFKGSVMRHFRRVMPYVPLASAVLLMLAGSWLVVYWTTYLQ